MSSKNHNFQLRALAYVRASTNKQDINNQKLELFEFARQKRLHIDNFIEITISTRKTKKQRRIDEVMEKVKNYDVLIATELSRLGRSTTEVITIINELLKQGVRVILTKQNLDMKLHEQDMTSKILLTLFSLFAELERDLISIRTKEALASKKAQGVQLGKPRGTIQRSMYDKSIDVIKSQLDLMSRKTLYFSRTRVRQYIYVLF